MDDVEPRLEEVRRLADDGKLDQAHRLARSIVDEFPDHAGCWLLSGELAKKLGKHQECIESLEAASVLTDLPAEMQLALAECYAATGRYELAVWLMRDVPSKPDSTDCVVLKTAAALGRLGESAAALEHCLLVRDHSPDRSEAAFGVAYYMNRVGKEADEVLPHLRAAHDIDQNNTMYRVSLALCLDSLHRTNEAYKLVENLDLRSVEWPHCLTRLMEIFASASDQSRYLDCQARLQQLGEQLTGGKPK